MAWPQGTSGYRQASACTVPSCTVPTCTVATDDVPTYGVPTCEDRPVKIDYPRSGRRGLRRWLPSWRQMLLLAFLGCFAVVTVVVVVYQRTEIPSPQSAALKQVTVITDRNGAVLGRLGDTNRTLVPLSKMPLDLQHAVIAAEDRSFYANRGISPRGIARALVNDVRGGSTQGASTITQQYIKNFYLTQDRTWRRKTTEIVLALKIDQKLSKEQILENYLNTIYFGRGAYGVQAASAAYFAKDVSALDTAQSAMLAAVIQAPSLFDPAVDPANKARLESRFDYVLGGMQSLGWLAPSVRAQTTLPPVVKRATSNRLAGPRGYLIDTVRRELRTKGFSDAEIDGGGLRVRSTFDGPTQQAAISAIAAAGPKTGTKGLHIGLAAIDPATGAVVAMYGGPDYVTRPGLNDATQSIAQAGSTFKPFALAAGLEQGIGLRTRFDGSSPRRFPGFRKPVTNDDFTSYGRIDLVKATASSVNTVYVDLALQVGPERVVDSLVRAGIPEGTAGLQANGTTVLGTASPHVIDVASAYATFAAGGQAARPFTVLEVRTATGALRYKADVQRSRAFPSDVVADVDHALENVVTRGTGRAARAVGRPVAGKTGTTDENKSAWFAGYAPQLATAVALFKQDADGNPITLSGTGGLDKVHGADFPTAIWTAFMTKAVAAMPVQQFPPAAWIGGSLPPSASAAPSASSTPTPSSAPSASGGPGAPSQQPPPGGPAPSTPSSGGGAGGGSGGGASTPTATATSSPKAPAAAGAAPSAGSGP